MKSITLTKWSAMLIGILFGFPIGCLIVLGVIGMTLPHMKNPRFMKFGDLAIGAVARKDAGDLLAEELIMTKSSRLFLSISRSGLGKVSSLTLADGRRIILTLRASPETGKWTKACYGSTKLVGESYHDLDFDGHFDFKAITDSKGKVRSRHIYVQDIWRQIDRLRIPKAFSGTDAFTFRAGLGWQLDKTGENEGHQTMEDSP